MTVDIIVDSLPRLFKGTLITLEITGLSVTIGFCLAIPLAVMRVSSLRCLWMPVYAFIFYFRGTPLLV
ncbi:MAG: ABC transporter permease subunit, partial [Desulfovermiculus sp.]